MDRHGQVTGWPLTYKPSGVSVDPISCSATVTYYDESAIQEFTDTGSPSNLIPVNVSYPWDAVRLSSGDYVVSHGWGQGGVVIVNDAGRVLQSDTGMPSALDRPYSLAVSETGFILVADHDRGKIVLLDQSLRYIRDLVNLHTPTRIWLDEGRGLLYAAQESLSSNVRVYSLK